MKRDSFIARVLASSGGALAVAGLLFVGISPAFAVVDSVAPTVGAVSPTTVSEDTYTTFSATYHDPDPSSGINYCQLILDGGTDLGHMTLGPNDYTDTATLAYTFSSPGSHTLNAQCVDNAGNWGYGPVTTITIPTPGTVSAVTPISAFAGVTSTFSATYSGFNSPFTANGCWLVVDGSTVYPGMNLSGGAGSVSGTASKDYVFTSAGSHTMAVSCLENNGGTYRVGATTPITVTMPPPDTTPPTVSAVSPVTATVGSMVSWSATYTDNVGVTQCQLVEGGNVLGLMTLSGPATNGTANLTYAFSSAGTHHVQAQCRDAAGNWGYGATTAITVNAAVTADTIPPTVGQIVQTSAIVGVAVTLSASATDNVGVTQCDLYVNGTDQGTMTVSGGVASRAYTFTNAGSFGSYVWCRDAADNTATGAIRVISVTNAAPGPGMPAYGTLVKLACPAGAGVNDPCKAVYYFGRDNRRHAFPNEKVYFTWYADFSGVAIVSSSVMASMTLGSNVTYRPGIRMVKFTTVPKTYAVTRGGVLRWVTSEALAVSLYGSNWNTKIDDISDAFYANYSFGADINSTSDYNPSAEAAAVPTIDDNL